MQKFWSPPHQVCSNFKHSRIQGFFEMSSSKLICHYRTGHSFQVLLLCAAISRPRFGCSNPQSSLNPELPVLDGFAPVQQLWHWSTDRHGQSSQSGISTVKTATPSRKARQTARQNSNLKFSGWIYHWMPQSFKASSVAKAMAQQGRENPFINPENQV